MVLSPEIIAAEIGLSLFALSPLSPLPLSIRIGWRGNIMIIMCTLKRESEIAELIF